MDLSSATQRMQDALDHLRQELAQIRTGRASSSLVSDILVNAYESKLMIKELAQISTPEPNTILISPWDKAVSANIVSAINSANLGFNALEDGDLIKIVIPPLTTERREQFIKQMHTNLEKFKVEIRQIRHEFIEAIRGQKSEGSISKDEEMRLHKEVQKVHDEHISQIDQFGKAKEEQLREI